MEARESCVFHQNWMDAAHTIEDKAMRCYFYEAVLQYALTGMKMDVLPELKLVLTLIYGLIDKDKEKYEKICEKRREAGKRGMQNRWHGTDITNDNKDNKCYQDITNDNKDNHADTETGTETDTVTDTDRIINDSNKIIPPTPFGGLGGGGAKSFNEFFEVVRNISVPKKVIDSRYELQYIWRMVDGTPGYGIEIRKAIETSATMDQFESAVQIANRKFKPSSDFQAVKLAVAMSGLKSQAQVKAVCAEVERCKNDPGIFHDMIEKVEYMRAGNKVGNLAGFMKSRK